jgi:hypothetical protein
MYVPGVLFPASMAVAAVGCLFRSESGRRAVVIRREELSRQIPRNRGHFSFCLAPILWLVHRFRPPFGEEHTCQEVSEAIHVAGPKLVERDAINARDARPLNNFDAHGLRTGLFCGVYAMLIPQITHQDPLAPDEPDCRFIGPRSSPNQAGGEGQAAWRTSDWEGARSSSAGI